jgi:hypothetical protein
MELDEFGFIQHPNGDVYVCGPTESSNFPTTANSFQPNHGGGTSDSFVARLTPDLTKLVASTFLGGSYLDIASDMVLDKDGYICVVGHTTSDDFPVTSGAYDTSYVVSFWDQFDVFITILTPELDEVVASTYIGGSNPEYFNQIRVAVDTNGHIVVAGATISWDYPVTSNAYCSMGGANTGPDAFISRLSPDLSELYASTYFVGNGLEQVIDLAVDHENNICICGITGSSNLPTTPGAYNTTFNGDGDAYISKLGNDLDTLIASTFIGGGGIDYAHSMEFDKAGNIYICGETESGDFPFTSGAYDSTFNYGFWDGYVSLLDYNLENLLASTFLGSSGWDFNRDIMYDETTGDVFITGLAGHADFPVSINAYDTSFNGESDLFITRMDNALTRLIASTFIGGEWDDFGLELVLSDDDNIFVGGNSYSDEFPTTPGAYSPASNGSYDVTLTLIDKDLMGQTVGIATPEKGAKETGAVLFYVYPNPCTAATQLRYMIPDKRSTILDIHQISGMKVKRLTNNVLDAGTHELEIDVSGLPSGIYFLRLRAGRDVVIKKLLVVH